MYVVCASQQASKFFVNMTSLQKNTHTTSCFVLNMDQLTGFEMIVMITALSRPQLQVGGGRLKRPNLGEVSGQRRQAIALEIESRLRHNLRMKRRRSENFVKKKNDVPWFFFGWSPDDGCCWERVLWVVSWDESWCCTREVIASTQLRARGAQGHQMS